MSPEQSKMAHQTTTGVRSLKPRTFTMQQIEEASGMQAGFCLACGAMQECCEPDARKYRCDNCGKWLHFAAYGAATCLAVGLIACRGFS
jgi:hypothetical protein